MIINESVILENNNTFTFMDRNFLFWNGIHAALINNVLHYKKEAEIPR